MISSLLYILVYLRLEVTSDVYEHLNRTRSGSKKYRLSFIRSSVVVLTLCKLNTCLLCFSLPSSRCWGLCTSSKIQRGRRVQRGTGTKERLHRRKKEGFVLDLNNGTRGFLGAIDETTLFFFTVCIGGPKCVNLRSTLFLTDWVNKLDFKFWSSLGPSRKHLNSLKPKIEVFHLRWSFHYFSKPFFFIVYRY